MEPPATKYIFVLKLYYKVFIRNLLFWLCCTIAFYGFAEEEELIPSTPEQLSSLQCDDLIGDLVSPLGGCLSMMKTDLVVKGAESLFLKRVYIPPCMPCFFTKDHHKQYERLFFLQHLSANYRGWQFLPHLRIKYNPIAHEVRLSTPYGATLDFQLEGSRLLTPHYALNNVSGDEPSGRHDLRNTRVFFKEGEIVVEAPDGTERFYQDRLLRKEILPNGRVIKYKYDDLRAPVYIESLDPKERYVYASIAISGNKRARHFRSSSGQSVDYTYQISPPFHVEVKDKSRNEKWNMPSPALLTHISSPFYREESLSYSDRFLLCDYAGGEEAFSTLHGNFNNQYRIQHLSGPDGSNVYEMRYESPLPRSGRGLTEVKKSDGTKILYHFSKKLLLTRVQYFNDHMVKEKIYTWTDNQWLQSLEIRDGENKTLSHKSYQYDAFGNPILEELTGDLSASIRREFSQDGKNLLLKEEHESGKTLCYSYLPGTNLITAKLTKDRHHIILREFFVYDDCHLLIKTIKDDGSGESLEDLSGVKQRTVQNITLRQSAPFLHMPEWIEEKYFEEGCEKLLSRKHLIYDLQGNIAIEEVYDADARLAYTIHKEYNERGDLLSETNALGQKATYEYDSKGRCVKEINFSGRVQTTRRFDTLGHLLEEIKTGETSHRTLFAYDDYGRLIKKTDAFDQSTHYTNDPLANQATKVEYPDQSSTYAAYDALGQKISETDANGNTKRYRYNAYGSVTEIAYPDGGKEFFRYSNSGFLTEYTDQDGLTVHYTRDVLGRVLSKTYPCASETFTYHGSNLLSQTDKAGHLTTYAYDGAGRKIREDAAGHIIDYSYDALGRLSCTTKHNGANTLYIHMQRDLEGRILEETKTDAKGHILYRIAHTYDADGNKASVTRSNSMSTYTYDAFGRLLEYKDPCSFTTTESYNENAHNALGQRVLQTTSVNPLGITTLQTHDVRGRLVKKDILTPQGQLLSSREMRYDPHGNLLTQKDHVYKNGEFGGTQTLTYTYTPNHQIGSITQGPSKTTWAYTPSGKIASKTLPSGTTLTYSYDSLGFLKRITSSDDQIAHTFEYDALGNLKCTADKNCRIARTVDPFGNVTGESFSTGIVINKEYDAFNRLTKLKIPTIGEVSHTYDPLFLRKVTRTSENGAILYTHLYENYDLDGNPVSEKLIGNLGEILHQTDNRGQKTAISSPYFSQACTYDPLGNLLDNTERRYTYDGLSQIASEDNRTYSYDSLYNRDPVNDANQLLAYSYDLNGNQTEKDQFSLTYDPLNRLIQAESASQTITFSYDPLGRRLSKTSGLQEERYIYQGNTEIGALDNNKLKSFRVLGLNTIAVELNGERPFAALADVQDNIRRLVDLESKTISESYDFTAFGKELSSKDISNPWRFASKRCDPELNLIYFGKRYYDPEIARWMSPDPAGFIDSVNLYQYVFNNPFRYKDPDGQWVMFFPALTVTFDLVFTWITAEAVSAAAIGTGLGVGVYQLNKMSDRHQSHSHIMWDEANVQGKENEKGKRRGEEDQNNQKNKNDQKSAGYLQKEIERRNAPKTVDRVDKGRVNFEKDHVHFKDGSALNSDGTWKHGGKQLTREESGWLQENGWGLPRS